MIGNKRNIMLGMVFLFCNCSNEIRKMDWIFSSISDKIKVAKIFFE